MYTPSGGHPRTSHQLQAANQHLTQHPDLFKGNYYDTDQAQSSFDTNNYKELHYNNSKLSLV